MASVLHWLFVHVMQQQYHFLMDYKSCKCLLREEKIRPRTIGFLLLRFIYISYSTKNVCCVLMEKYISGQIQISRFSVKKKMGFHSSSKLSGHKLKYWPSSPVYLRSHRHHGATILGSVAKYFENTDNSNDDGTDSTCVVNVHPKPCR